MLIALLAGGLSRERNISINSAKFVRDALEDLSHDVVLIDPDHSLCKKLFELKPDIVFNCLHGSFGEDGCIQGMLEFIGIPYTHSGVLASALAMDKFMSKHIATSIGIPVPDGIKINTDELFSLIESKKDPIKKPYVIKPVQQGSTIGISLLLDDQSNYPKREEWDFGKYAIVEEYISGAELSVPVIANKALGVLELRPSTGFYNYDAKYKNGITEHIYPANIPEEVINSAKRYAQMMHEKLQCRTLSRSDFRYDESRGGLYFLEINTHPGLTELSILPEVALYNGISMKDIVSLLLKEAECEIKA
ncbi:D-alanine--D-alanine ligase B [Candidatus Cyrtobacter comes]|uniref:D-alanine--D-alanine ligase n=1 Tax=Candidatus Cyrtobacter comes TaxID=675776 RepID=A0ABU5L6Q2_9RICK|nr:D-alanine--D-alanine ligase [Candidatus Cyrtobacter comes]MDZ5761801.1 D-alanine--D-alanine ligase B [Candidatus Cyrtobacter comes]